MKTTTRYSRHITTLRNIAAEMLDKTHEIDGRDAATWLARQAVAKWLDLGGQIPVRHIQHLQRVAA